jgi:hypothetical protein
MAAIDALPIGHGRKRKMRKGKGIVDTIKKGI